MKCRAFLAHKRATNDKRIDQMVAGATLLLRDQGADFAQVVAGRDDFKARSASLGGWKPWQRDVATGADEYGNPSFHAIIVPDLQIGKATAEMVRDAIGSERAVYFWCKSELVPVVGIETVDAEDWKEGWRLQTQGSI